VIVRDQDVLLVFSNPVGWDFCSASSTRGAVAKHGVNRPGTGPAPRSGILQRA